MTEEDLGDHACTVLVAIRCQLLCNFESTAAAAAAAPVGIIVHLHPPLPSPASLTWPRADLVVIQLDVVTGGDGRVLALLSALAALLLLHLPLLWGHKGTGSHPAVNPNRPEVELQVHHLQQQPSIFSALQPVGI